MSTNTIRGALLWRGHRYEVLLEVAGPARGVIHLFDAEVAVHHPAAMVMSGAHFDFTTCTVLLGDASTYSKWDERMLPYVEATVARIWAALTT
jgi:hypothetical protein